MKTVTLTQRNPVTPVPGNYRVDLAITSSNDITAYLFVKQRIIRPDNTIDDVFATVASPVQIEDLPQTTPEPGDVYFRDSSVSLVSSDPSLLQEIVDQITADIQLTLQQSTDLDNLAVAQTITIDPTSVVVDTGV